MGHTFIIAEAGINHNAIFSEACRLASAAKDSGADAVKFQTWFRNDWPQYDYLRFTKDEWQKLFNYCEIIGIKWFSTPFDHEAIEFLASHGMDIWKIPSGMITHHEYIKHVRYHLYNNPNVWGHKCASPLCCCYGVGNYIDSLKDSTIIISTGMASYEEVILCKYCFEPQEQSLISFLHCVTGYPSLPEEINLNVLKNDIFDGLSDHTPGIEIPIAAVALGAKVIEKHLTLDRNQDGPDHQASLEPHEFKEMVRCIRNVEKAMGDGVKKPTPSELQVRDEIRQRMKIPAKEG